MLLVRMCLTDAVASSRRDEYRVVVHICDRRHLELLPRCLVVAVTRFYYHDTYYCQ